MAGAFGRCPSGAEIIAEIAGYRINSDGMIMFCPIPKTGEWAQAIENANMTPADIDPVSLMPHPPQAMNRNAKRWKCIRGDETPWLIPKFGHLRSSRRSNWLVIFLPRGWNGSCHHQCGQSRPCTQFQDWLPVNSRKTGGVNDSEQFIWNAGINSVLILKKFVA